MEIPFNMDHSSITCSHLGCTEKYGCMEMLTAHMKFRHSIQHDEACAIAKASFASGHDRREDEMYSQVPSSFAKKQTEIACSGNEADEEHISELKQSTISAAGYDSGYFSISSSRIEQSVKCQPQDLPASDYIRSIPTDKDNGNDTDVNHHSSVSAQQVPFPSQPTPGSEPLTRSVSPYQCFVPSLSIYDVYLPLSETDTKESVPFLRMDVASEKRPNQGLEIKGRDSMAAKHEDYELITACQDTCDHGCTSGSTMEGHAQDKKMCTLPDAFHETLILYGGVNERSDSLQHATRPSKTINPATSSLPIAPNNFATTEDFLERDAESGFTFIEKMQRGIEQPLPSKENYIESNNLLSSTEHVPFRAPSPVSQMSTRSDCLTLDSHDDSPEVAINPDVVDDVVEKFFVPLHRLERNELYEQLLHYRENPNVRVEGQSSGADQPANGSTKLPFRTTGMGSKRPRGQSDPERPGGDGSAKKQCIARPEPGIADMEELRWPCFFHMFDPITYGSNAATGYHYTLCCHNFKTVNHAIEHLVRRHCESLNQCPFCGRCFPKQPNECDEHVVALQCTRIEHIKIKIETKRNIDAIKFRLSRLPRGTSERERWQYVFKALFPQHRGGVDPQRLPDYHRTTDTSLLLEYVLQRLSTAPPETTIREAGGLVQQYFREHLQQDHIRAQMLQSSTAIHTDPQTMPLPQQTYAATGSMMDAQLATSEPLQAAGTSVSAHEVSAATNQNRAETITSSGSASATNSSGHSTTSHSQTLNTTISSMHQYVTQPAPVECHPPSFSQATAAQTGALFDNDQKPPYEPTMEFDENEPTLDPHNGVLPDETSVENDENEPMLDLYSSALDAIAFDQDSTFFQDWEALFREYIGDN